MSASFIRERTEFLFSCDMKPDLCNWSWYNDTRREILSFKWGKNGNKEAMAEGNTLTWWESYGKAEADKMPEVQWLMSQSIPFEYEVDRGYIHEGQFLVKLFDPKHATLFKLTWGGNV